MKKLSRDEMKNVMGGTPPPTKFKWDCLVSDPGFTPSRVNLYCKAVDPSTVCLYTSDCIGGTVPCNDLDVCYNF